jgi:membrane protease YdiL (CAAX protease family)
MIRPGWLLWQAPGVFALAFGVGLGFRELAGAVGLGGHDASSPGVLLTTVVLQDALLVALPVLLIARAGGRPRIADFGIRPAELKRTVITVVAGIIAFVVLSVAITLWVSGPATPRSGAGLLSSGRDVQNVIAVAVIVGLASLAEEFFFRGFAYVVLRSHLGVLTATVIVAAVFGAAHANQGLGLRAIVVLAILGAMLCLAYELTDTLYAPVAFHASINALAVAGGTGDQALGWLATGLGVSVALGCLLAGRWQTRRAEFDVSLG